MSTVWQIFYDGALDVARVFAKIAVLKHMRITIAPRESSPNWCGDEEDLSLLRPQHSLDTIAEQQDDPALESESKQSQDSDSRRSSASSSQRLVSEEPCIPFGEPAVIVARDAEDQLCFTTTITSRFLECFNNAAQYEQDYDSNKETIEKLESRKRELYNMLDKRKATSTDPETDTKFLEYQELIRQKIADLDQTKQGMQEQISIDESNFTFCKTKIHEMLEDVLKEANLLKDVTVKIDNRFDDDKTELEDLNPIFDSKPQDPELSEDEQLREDARKAYNHARSYKTLVEAHFDDMKAYEQEQLHQYLQQVSQGAADQTRSEFDVQALMCNMQMTRDLINAELDLEDAKEQAEELGLFAGGCAIDDDSDSGWDVGEAPPVDENIVLPSGLDPDQTDLRDFERPMTEGERVKVDKWLGKVDEEADPKNMLAPKDNLIDDTELLEPEMFESVSMVDPGPLGAKICQWQTACEEKRQQWRDKYPVGTPREVYGHALKRRMSF